MYTSGTTANPKGCLISHESLVRTATTSASNASRSRHGDRIWDPLPLFHLASILPFNGCLVTGATYVGLVHFEAGEALEALESGVHGRVRRLRPDLGGGARPPAVRRDDLSALRLVNVNGVPERLAPWPRGRPG